MDNQRKINSEKSKADNNNVIDNEAIEKDENVVIEYIHDPLEMYTISEEEEVDIPLDLETEEEKEREMIDLAFWEEELKKLEEKDRQNNNERCITVPANRTIQIEDEEIEAICPECAALRNRNGDKLNPDKNHPSRN